MFFTPALAVIAATGIQSAYAAAIPAITQQAAVDSIASSLDLSSVIGDATNKGNNKRDAVVADYDSLADEDKDAFLQFIPMAISAISGLFKGKRDLEHVLALRNVDFSTMSEEDKKAFIPALIGGAISLFGSIFGGNKKRDGTVAIPDYDSVSDEDKDAFFQFIPMAIGAIGSLFKGKRDLEPVLALRNVDFSTMSDEDKKALWPALAGLAASFIPSIIGKFTGGNNKRGVPAYNVLADLSDDDKEALFGSFIQKLLRPLKGVMRRDVEEMLYARDAGFADAFFAEEF